MRIGIDLRCLESPFRTGVGEYTVELLNAIFGQPSNHEFFLFSNTLYGAPLPSWNFPNVHLVQTHLPNKLLTASTLLFHRPRLDRLLKNKIGQPIDLFFSPNLNFTALTPGTKHILVIHDLSFIFFPEYYSTKQRLWHRLANIKKQAQNANHIVTLSNNTKRDVSNYLEVAAEKITVIAPGVPSVMTKPNNPSLEQVRAKYHLPHYYVLYVGTIEPRKNVLGLIRAFEMAASRLPHMYNLVLAGSLGFDNEHLEARIAASALKSRIQVLGYVTPEDKPALYAGAAATVYPSFYEGFGFPVLEAMSAGSPVITSNRSSLPEVANGAASLINPHHPEEIAESLQRLLNDPVYRADQIKKGTAQSQTFSWRQTAVAWLNLVERIIS